jgi:hydrogenase nickel incorporation protein HypB
MFHAANLVLITKIDLLPHLPGIKVDTIVSNLARVMPKLRVIPLSAVTGDGMTAWVEWLRQHERHAVTSGA